MSIDDAIWGTTGIPDDIERTYTPREIEHANGEDDAAYFSLLYRRVKVYQEEIQNGAYFGTKESD